jgi:virginiamycin B lyase
VTRAGNSEQGWRNNLQMMINVGAALPKDQIDVLTQYLATNFPEKPEPDAVVMPGSSKVSIQEWTVPMPSSRPHNPLVARDGSLWYTRQFGNVRGRLDPQTGQIKEYHLKTPNAGPHDLAADKDGNIWYTGTFKVHIGKLNPSTREVTEYPMPDPAARDPHTMEIREYVLPNAETRPRRIAITNDDVLWYSDYACGYLGRFDPATGKTSEWPSPGGPKSQPYGIYAVRDVLWYSEAGVKPYTVVRFDPKTETFQTWVIPSGGGVVRNMDATRDGNLVLACSGVNGIAMVHVQ